MIYGITIIFSALLAIVIYKLHKIDANIKRQFDLIQAEVNWFAKYTLFQSDSNEFNLWGLRNDCIDKMNNAAKNEKYEEAACYKEAAATILSMLQYYRDNMKIKEEGDSQCNKNNSQK